MEKTNEVSVSEAMARERELMEEALRGDPAFVWAMQSVEGRKSLDAPATMAALREVRKFLLEQSGYVLGLVEAAEGHLSELHGPAFAAWRCDECGRVIAEDTLLAARGESGWPEGAWVGVRDGCWDRSAPKCGHGVDPTGAELEMRHVLCRVTADSPEAT